MARRGFSESLATRTVLVLVGRVISGTVCYAVTHVVRRDALGRPLAAEVADRADVIGCGRNIIIK